MCWPAATSRSSSRVRSPEHATPRRSPASPTRKWSTICASGITATDGVPNGEAIDDVAARADRVIGRVQSVDGDVLVFAHGHILRVLSARWLEMDPSFGRSLILSPATLSILGHEREAPALEVWNAPVG
jgi:broad specificity phosphatase PhoE